MGQNYYKIQLLLALLCTNCSAFCLTMNDVNTAETVQRWFGFGCLFMFYFCLDVNGFIQ